nr:MAG TPA: hypothetical protein [Caudoviricetes sp.]
MSILCISMFLFIVANKQRYIVYSCLYLYFLG